MNRTEWLMLLVLSVLWGGSFFFVGFLVRNLPAFTIVFLRVALGAAILGAAALAFGMRMPAARSAWAAFLAMGLLNNAIPFCLIAWGQGQIASGLAAVLNATTPIWTVLIAHALTPDEKITAHRLLGVLIGFVGVVLLFGLDTNGGPRAHPLAQGAVLAGAVCYAFAGVFGRRFRVMEIDPLLTATGQLTASAIVLLPVVLLVDRPWTLPTPSWRVWAAVACAATFSTALGYVLYFRILATAGATNLLLVTLLIPVSAILMGTLFLGEPLELRRLVSFVCIAAGLAAIDGRLFARFLRLRHSEAIR